MAKAATAAEHEAAIRYLTVVREWCHDLAIKETAHLAPPVRVAVQRRYEEIVLLLHSKHPERLSAIQQVERSKLLKTAASLQRETASARQKLLAVFPKKPRRIKEKPLSEFNQKSKKTASRRRIEKALFEFNEVKEKNERQLDALGDLLIPASLSSNHREADIVALERSKKDLGKDLFFAQLDARIRRYLIACMDGKGGAATLPLLRPLALEWLRDTERLWGFLEAVFQRWEDTSPPGGDHARDLAMHNVLEICPGATMRDVVYLLEKSGKLKPNASGAYDRLRKRSSRNIKDAKAHGIV